jgi:thymidylate synthase ThyX
MTLSSDDAKRIAPFVSNLDRDVFALAGLPEEVVAVLFAYYSRSREDLRTNLAKLLVEDELGSAESGVSNFRFASEKAKAFHEKWVVGYGHASVAEHAVVHLALENVSIVATKTIEDMRLGSYTEKSTRYVAFDEGSFQSLPSLPPELAARYEETCRGLFRTYLSLIPRVEEKVRAAIPRGEKQPERAYDASMRAKTFDLLRGLLPASTKTNLGLTANARSIETLLSKMLASPLAEVTSLAEEMHKESQAVAPTLVKYVAKNAYRVALRETVAPMTALALPPASYVAVEPRSGVDLIDYDGNGLDRVIASLAIEAPEMTMSAEQIAGAVSSVSLDEKTELLRAALVDRGRFDPVPRAFEAARLAFEIVVDYGAWRDLQRHRLLSPFVQRLGCELGYVVPPELEDLGFADEFRAALDGVVPVWRAMVDECPWQAQYVVPLAYRMRTTWHMNLREWFHVVELRSSKAGHPSYRAIAQEMYRALVNVWPWLEGTARVDLGEYRFGRVE